MNNYLNFLFIIYNFLIDIYKILFIRSPNDNYNLNFIYITDFLGTFYVINQEEHLTFHNQIIFEKKSIISHIKERKITNDYIITNKLYPQSIKLSQYNGTNIIKPNFIKFNSFYLPIYYHILDIQKYNPYGVYIYLLIINGIKINKYLLFKPHFNITQSNRNKILESKYYIKDNNFEKLNNKMSDINYLKYFQ